MQLKNSTRALYFDCVLNAIVKSDEVVGISALARDVTEEREKERRFTELFETLQEGVYFSTPEGKLLDANPALVQMLGCSSRDELLSLDPSTLNLDPGQGPVLGRSADDRGSERSRELTLRRKDGTTGVFLDTSRAVWDGAGKIIRYQGTLVDVTERRKMEKVLAPAGGIPTLPAGKLPRPDPGGRPGWAVQLCQFAHSRSAGPYSGGHAGKESG